MPNPNDTPLLPTWKGNLPQASLQHYIEWVREAAFTRFRELFVHEGFTVRECVYTLDHATGKLIGQDAVDALDRSREGALIYTSKGNLPIAELTHHVEIVDTETDTALNDIYRDASGEIVKKSAYVHGKKGLEIGAQQAVLA